MTDEEKLLADIVLRTRSGGISWSVTPISKFEGIVFNPKAAFRVFVADYDKSGEEYQILLVEKKTPDPEWDFEIEIYKVELYVLQDRVLVLTMGENVLAREDLFELVNLVEMRSDRAKKLFR